LFGIDKETGFLIKITEDLYKKTQQPDVDINEISIDRFNRIALKNNILYYAAKKLVECFSLKPELREKFGKIISKGDLQLHQIKRSIDEVQQHIKGHVIFKTYRGENFPRIGNDIDVLVRNEKLNSIKKEFIARGYRAEFDDQKEKGVVLLKEGQKKIHLQGAITWCWREYLDEELIYRNPREVMYNGQKITIPNINVDFLSHLAHMNFEPLLITYSELLYLFKLIPKVDFDIILEQARKYNWQKTFFRTLNIIDSFHSILYGKSVCDKVKFKRVEINRVVFPYLFSRKHLILTAIEKRLFFYPLTRIFRTLNILFTGKHV